MISNIVAFLIGMSVGFITCMIITVLFSDSG